MAERDSGLRPTSHPSVGKGDIVESSPASEGAGLPSTQEIADLYGPLLMRIAFRMFGNSHDAEDAVQDLYIRLPEAMEQFDSSRPFKPWLVVTAGRLYVDRLRSNKARNEREHKAGKQRFEFQSSKKGSNPEIKLVRKETLVRLRRQLDAFAADDRTLFALCLEKEYSLGAAAEVLGITKDAARNRLFRLRRALRETLIQIDESTEKTEGEDV